MLPVACSELSLNIVLIVLVDGFKFLAPTDIMDLEHAMLEREGSGVLAVELGEVAVESQALVEKKGFGMGEEELGEGSGFGVQVDVPSVDVHLIGTGWLVEAGVE